MVQLLELIGQHTGIGTKREWVFVGCDGPLYCLASQLIDEHPEKFDWLTLTPGLDEYFLAKLLCGCTA